MDGAQEIADMRFDEHSLRAAIVERWGPAGAHVDVFDHILAEVERLTAERDEARAWGMQQRAERIWPMELLNGKRVEPSQAWPAPWEHP